MVSPREPGPDPALDHTDGDRRAPVGRDARVETISAPEMKPLANIRLVQIVNSNAAVVLSADLGSPDQAQYLVKRALTKAGHG